ncbi:hypothetical protein VVT58_11545 [Sphingobium sp. SJ10-10]|uniref:hypothetical protein n=1 Tax=Sphingobium sp. SJ10-10 TaxID=3114999 RepID=UPI002E1833DC|nr:hypothetical protein [Sphingobium sp. SJ10-10]
MGFRFSLLFATPLMLATSALAQQENAADPVFNLPRTTQPQTTNPNRQGPELDVFRGAPATVTPPPVVAPTIQVPPVVIPTPQPAPQQPQQRRPAEPRRAPRPAPQSQTPPESAAPGEPPSAPPAVENQAFPPADNGATPAPQVAPLAPAEEPAANWPWIAAPAGVALLIGAFLWLRRRKPEEVEEAYYEPEPAPPPPAPRPAQPKAAPVPPPAPAKPEPAPAATDRPWLDLAMDVQAARLTLMGATIGYMLTLHNRGTQTAEDILVRSLIANADAQQQALFQQFFAGETGLPVHSIVSIAPGETQRLTGEMRLNAQEIAAIQMGQRALLIPLIAFDAQYRWTGGSEGIGRTGRAFIVGEEQSPPVERLSPFRLDLGPRQYRTPGSRATALSLAS